MSPRQIYIINKVREQISTLRSMLDDVMYRTDQLPPDEFKRIRECYDKICEAGDNI